MVRFAVGFQLFNPDTAGKEGQRRPLLIPSPTIQHNTLRVGGRLGRGTMISQLQKDVPTKRCQFAQECRLIFDMSRGVFVNFTVKPKQVGQPENWPHLNYRLPFKSQHELVAIIFCNFEMAREIQFLCIDHHGQISGPPTTPHQSMSDRNCLITCIGQPVLNQPKVDKLISVSKLYFLFQLASWVYILRKP